jgi:hypothetical protein
MVAEAADNPATPTRLADATSSGQQPGQGPPEAETGP